MAASATRSQTSTYGSPRNASRQTEARCLLDTAREDDFLGDVAKLAVAVHAEVPYELLVWVTFTDRDDVLWARDPEHNLVECNDDMLDELREKIVNGQDVARAKTCASFIGQTVTAADASLMCDAGGTTYPIGSTSCANGGTYLTFGPVVSGAVGKVAIATTPDQAMDRETCALT